MRRAYIAAPWWHPSPLVREWNTRRAELLARLAAAEGFEPVCVHRALMDAGVDDDADPEARARGLERTCATVREIAREGGALYGLMLDSGLDTSGTEREADAFASTPWVPGRFYRRATWRMWERNMKRAGLLAEWQALVVPPC